MGDIETLLHDYCREQISRLSWLLPILTVVMKKHSGSQLNDKIYDHSINYVCVYHDYCQLLPISIIINLRKAHDVDYCQ